MVKENKSSDPIHVSLFGADRVMSKPDAIPDLIQKFTRFWMVCNVCKITKFLHFEKPIQNQWVRIN